MAFLRAPPPGAGGLPDVTGGRALLAALDLADTPAGRWALLPTAPDLAPEDRRMWRQVVAACVESVAVRPDPARRGPGGRPAPRIRPKDIVWKVDRQRPAEGAGPGRR